MTDPSEQARALEVAFDIATEHIHALPGRHVGPRADLISVSNWSTTEPDAVATVQAILDAHLAE